MSPKLRDNYGITGWGITAIIIAFVILLITVCTLVSAGTNIAWTEGVETTVTGKIQLKQWKYNKFWNYEYTDCELLTYSGDTHHITLFGHVDLQYEKTYQITYAATNYWAHLYLVNRPVSIIELGENQT